MVWRKRVARPDSGQQATIEKRCTFFSPSLSPRSSEPSASPRSLPLCLNEPMTPAAPLDAANGFRKSEEPRSAAAPSRWGARSRGNVSRLKDVGEVARRLLNGDGAEERKSEKGGGQMSSSKSKGVACRVGIQRASASLQGRLVSSTTTMSTTTMSATNSSFPARSPPLIQAGRTVLSPSLQRERIKHHSRPPRRDSRIKGGCSAGAGEMRVGGSWTALVLDRAGLRRDVAVRDTKANEEEDEKEERERARARARVERANEFFWSAPVGSLEGASSSSTARR